LPVVTSSELQGQQSDDPGPVGAPVQPRVDLEWGLAGARHFADLAEVVVVVDVLSFSTSVTVACEQGARVWPHPGGEQAHELARSIEAVLAGTRSHTSGPSLSPASLLDLPEQSRLVLPSPNGSSVSHALMGSKALVLVGCLRNASAVAGRIDRAIDEGARSIALVPAGERWGDGSLRVAYEDLVGAGAVVARLAARRPGLVLSPEAQSAALTFARSADLAGTPSGRELVERDFAADVAIASEVDASAVVPTLREGCFTA
jgi:2-phosphosulfolactate phosphatase